MLVNIRKEFDAYGAIFSGNTAVDCDVTATSKDLIVRTHHLVTQYFKWSSAFSIFPKPIWFETI